jgi:hypothetical protein
MLTTTDIFPNANNIGNAIDGKIPSFARVVDFLKQEGKVLDAFLGNILRLPGAEAADISLGRSKKYMESRSYTKGDGAKSVQEFSDAVKNEFYVFSNKNALESNKFMHANAIFVWGENHANVMIPGHRTERGTLLAEDPHSERCLEKHLLHPDNKCKNIDIVDNTGADKAILALHASVQKLIHHLDAEKGKEFHQLAGHGNSVAALLHQMQIFLNNNFDRIYSSQSPHIRQQTDIFTREVQLASDKYNTEIQSTLNKRDEVMINEAAKMIKAEGPGVSTTVLLGAGHAGAVSNGLMEKFRHRAMVVCIPKVVLDNMSKAERAAFQKAMKTQIVPPTPGGNAVNAEL